MFVFDTRRGTREGEELDKVLAFFPSTATAEQQQARAVWRFAALMLSHAASAPRLPRDWRRRWPR